MPLASVVTVSPPGFPESANTSRDVGARPRCCSASLLPPAPATPATRRPRARPCGVVKATHLSSPRHHPHSACP
eukprot:5250972-Pleurochrysis_carterae.AAC.1